MRAIEATGTCQGGSFTISGRAPRSGFWLFALVPFGFPGLPVGALSILKQALLERLILPANAAVSMVFAVLWRRVVAATLRRPHNSPSTTALPGLAAPGLVGGVVSRGIETLDSHVCDLLDLHENPVIIFPLLVGIIVLLPLNCLILPHLYDPGPNTYGPNPNEVPT